LTGDHGGYNCINNNIFIFTSCNLDIVMESPPQTPPWRNKVIQLDDSRCFVILNDALSQDNHLDLMGASCITGNIVLSNLQKIVTINLGGILCGKAMGNALNLADISPIEDFNQELPSHIGKVRLFVSNGNREFLDISSMQPAMTAEAPVTGTIQPVLEALADSYSPIQGLYFAANQDGI